MPTLDVVGSSDPTSNEPWIKMVWLDFAHLIAKNSISEQVGHMCHNYQKLKSEMILIDDEIYSS